MKQQEIELIQSSIDNGRIYFPISLIKFFPEDSLSARASDGHKGTDVTFIAGSHRFVGPIRVMSGTRLSPTKSFSKYLKEVAAKVGDFLVVTRASDREYHVAHRAKV